MRSNRNPSASVARSVVERNSAVEDRGVGEPRVAVGNDAKVAVPRLPASLPARMPMEWLDSGNWRLPSGKALAEFALQAGFLAPLLLRPDGLGRRGLKSGLLDGVRAKQFGKGESR
jgi:hypothetical protein